MSCRDFERALDEVFAGEAESERTQTRVLLERHAAECAACSELLELLQLPRADAVDVAGPVLERTSGGACRQAEMNLNDFVGGLSSVEDRELMAGHLEHCQGCSDLAGELERLTVDLPRLAFISPETSLVAAVLRRTLPVPVQLRRWWAATWPRWVLRPRFAVEFAFAATLVLVVVFATPGSPLQAMPERTLDLVRVERLQALEVLPEKAQGELASRLRSAGAGGERLALGFAVSAQAGLGTISDEVASWFVTADDEPPAQEPPNMETP